MLERRNQSCRNAILVTGAGGTVGWCVSNYLASQGCVVLGADTGAARSNVEHYFEVPAPDDASFIPIMLKIVRDFDVGLLVPTVAEELPVFAREKFVFAALGCEVLVASPQAVDIANDKLKTAQFFERQGIAVPRTVPGEIMHADVVKSLGLPVIAKPRFSHGGSGVVLYTSFETQLQERRSKIIYQEFMSGEEYDVNIFIDRKGLLKSCVVLRKKTLKDGVVGNALTVERVQREDIVELCSRAVKALGITGAVDIDVREDAAGIPRLLEINARFGANAWSASEVMDDLMTEWKAGMQLFEEAL